MEGIKRLEKWPRARIEACLAAAQELERRLAEGPSLPAILTGGAPIAAGQHYPSGDAFAQGGALQFYFHAHPDARDEREIGHLHVFLRADALHGGAAPILAARRAARLALDAPPANGYAHLIAMGFDGDGAPLSLFTVNQWVTGESWLPARALITGMDRLSDLEGEGDETRRLLSLMLRVWQAEIEALLMARDAALGPDAAQLEDRQKEVLSQRDIALARQIRVLRRLVS